MDKAPFLAVAAVVLIVTFAARETADARFRPATLAEFGLIPRVMQAFYIWAYYVWKPWAPYDLSPSYTTLHAFNPFDAVFILSAVGVIAITVAAARRWRDRPEWLALCACHLALLAPVIGVSEYPHSAYDRYSHLHGALWAVLLGFVFRAGWADGRRVSLPAVTVGATALLFAVLAWQQVPAWRDTIPLYQHIVAHAREHPSRARFDEILGVHYLKTGATNKALISFTNAIAFEARRADRHILNEGVLHRSHVRAGDTLAALGRTNEAAEHYGLALAAKPRVLPVILKHTAALRVLGREADAAHVLEEALKFYPGHPELQRQLNACLAKLRPAAEQ